MTEQLNIFSALCELKVLDKRIAEKMCTSYVVVKPHCDTKLSTGATVDDFAKTAHANYDSVLALMARRTAIKNAIAVSNAKTMITVADKTMTVAEAIEMRKTGIQVYAMVRDQLMSQHSKSTRDADNFNGALRSKAEEYVARIFSAKEKSLTDEMVKMRDAYIEANTMEVIDPINAKAAVEKLTEFIDKFDAEIDSKLSVSNALTIIEINY